MLSASYWASEPLLFQDRIQFWNRAQTITQRYLPTLLNEPCCNSDPLLTYFSPQSLLFAASPLGTTPNISSQNFIFDGNGNIVGVQPLVLKNGTSLGSPLTFIPTGTTSATSATSLDAALLRNAGHYNATLPSIVWQPNGLRSPLELSPTTESLMGSVRREMSQYVDVFVDVRHTENNTTTPISPLVQNWLIPPSAPDNPFNNQVLVTFPTETSLQQ